VAPNRILVKEVNWLGDLVMSLPALRAVRAAFASSKLAVLVLRDLAGIFDGISWIDEVITYPAASGLGTLSRDLAVIRSLRSGHFDLAISFPNSFASALWITLAGVPQRAGYATDGRGLMLNHRATPSSEALMLHQSHYWLEMVRDTLGVEAPVGAADYKLEPSAANVDRARTWLAERRKKPGSSLIAIAPAAAYGPAKEWPLARYSALVDLLNDHYGAECVILGAPGERLKCEQVASTARTGAIVAAGQFDLGEQTALLSLCKGFAGNDSGAMHLAGAVGIAVVGIFGSTNPVRTGPMGDRVQTLYHPPPCSPCLARTCRFGHYDCLRAVGPEEVAATLQRLGAFGGS
jgi:heptosyltransferase-2